MNHPSVSVGFPVYNEEHTIGEVLTEAHRLLEGSGLDYEILVCNDGSTDGSPGIIKEIAGRFPSFRVIDHPRNLGIYRAFESLYSAASKEFVFINAADRQWDTGILFEMLPLTKEADIIVASRKKKTYGLFRGLVSWAFNAIPRVLFGVRTFDAGSVKLVKREIIERFPLVSRSPFSEAERLIRAGRAGYRILDYPVSVAAREAGRAKGVRPKELLGAFADLVRVWHYVYFKEERY